MADVTGPISSLPGSRHSAPEGSMCDDHPDRRAVIRCQGETDSFGSEMHDLCEECFRQFKAATIAVTKAQAEADSRLAVAKANAESIRIEGEAQASAIRARAAALADNPALVDLTKAERWNGVLPTTMIPGAAIPFLSVGR